MCLAHMQIRVSRVSRRFEGETIEGNIVQDEDDD